MAQTTSGPVAAVSQKYRPIAELGRGGMATVFLAFVHGPGGFSKLQVVKRLRPALAADPEFLQMFLDEARLAARINHPHVVQTNEVGFDGQHYFIAMEYLDGQPLEAITRRAHEHGGVPIDLHLRILADTLAGLHFAHELKDFDGTPLNVVHRDVSPHNVFVTYEGTVKVLDFGIAKAADSSSETRTGILKGKCAYMAVEQFGGADVDRRADVFAVGVMAWQAATGRRLWKGLSDADIFARLANGDVPSPQSVSPDISDELNAIIMKALAREPEDRYASAAEFQSVLEDYLHSTGSRLKARDVGKYVADLFADRREAIRVAIEEQLTKAQTDAPATGELPEIAALVPGMAPDAVGSTGELNALAASQAAVVLPAAPQPRSRRLAVLGALAALGLAVVGVGLYLNARGENNDGAAGNSMTNAGGGPRAMGGTPDYPKAGLIKLTVRAIPQQAKLFLDDAPLPDNPVTQTFSRDGASHRIRAVAAGYDDRQEFVEFDEPTIDVTLTLEKTRAKPKPHARPRPHGGGLQGAGGGTSPTVTETAPPASAAPKPTGKPGPGIDPTPPWGSGKQQHTIEKGDPWAN